MVSKIYFTRLLKKKKNIELIFEDIITAAYLLNYAASEQELLLMCQNIKLNLAASGKFIGITHDTRKRPKYILFIMFILSSFANSYKGT